MKKRVAFLVTLARVALVRGTNNVHDETLRAGQHRAPAFSPWRALVADSST